MLVRCSTREASPYLLSVCPPCPVAGCLIYALGAALRRRVYSRFETSHVPERYLPPIFFGCQKIFKKNGSLHSALSSRKLPLFEPLLFYCGASSLHLPVLVCCPSYETVNNQQKHAHTHRRPASGSPGKNGPRTTAERGPPGRVSESGAKSPLLRS